MTDKTREQLKIYYAKLDLYECDGDFLGNMYERWLGYNDCLYDLKLITEQEKRLMKSCTIEELCKILFQGIYEYRKYYFYCKEMNSI